MKPSAFVYERPVSVADAVAILDEDPESKCLAGGQSLMPLLSMRLVAPSTLVDINSIERLGDISDGGAFIRIGATVRHSDVLSSELVNTHVPLLARATGLIANHTVRNRGTCVGSIVHCDPAAELPAVSLLLEAQVELVSRQGKRIVPASEFIQGPFYTDLAAGEMAVAVRFPKTVSGETVCDVREYSRRKGDYAVVGVAVRAGKPRETTCSLISSVYFGVDDLPTLIDWSFLADSIRSSTIDRRAVQNEVHGILSERLNLGDDLNGDRPYKLHVAGALTVRMLADIGGREDD